jgi:uncharacterized protein (DUF1015 family)
MSLVIPFAGLRPRPEYAGQVAAPPYDVMSGAEARAMVADQPLSFLHISRPEVDLPQGTDPYSPEVYAKARENLDRLRDDGVLVRDPGARFYVYRLSHGDQQQTGLVAGASVDAYLDGRIRRHELTRPVKEQDRVNQISAVDAQTGPVFLIYRAARALDAKLEAATRQSALLDVVADDGVRHQIWPVDAGEAVAELSAELDRMERLYIADGHHRAAAAARVAEERRPSQDSLGSDASRHFLSVLFPHDQLRILPYNRVVRDLHGLDSEQFLEQVARAYRIEPNDAPVAPTARGEVGLYLPGQWYRLMLDPARIPGTDPIGRLDVSLLHDHLIGPVLAITDPRRDERIDFVGGVRGLGGLSERVDSGEMAAAFSLPATRMDDLMSVADAGAMMPPKSTWFEPKLADGLISYLLE